MKYAMVTLPDDFEKGCCSDCPFSYTDWTGYEPEDRCVFNSRYDECPIEIKEKEKPLFTDVKIGDRVICFDEFLHDYIEHEVLVESIEEDAEYVTETNPKGKVLYGKDLSDDDDESMICTVFENNFVSVVMDEE